MVKEIRFGSDRHLMLNYGVFKCELGGFEVAVKTASQKIKIKDLIQINLIFVLLEILEKSVKVQNLPYPLLRGQPLNGFSRK